jgi:hypothetical protein
MKPVSENAAYGSMSDDRAITLHRIRTVSDDPDEDQATPYAKELAIVLVSESTPLPRASAAPWEDGSIFVYWSKGDMRLSLRVAASPAQDSYLYHRHGEVCGVERNVTPAQVAEWMRWFSGAPS